MYTQQEVELLLQTMLEAQPKELVRFMGENQAGIRAVLRLLHASQQVMTAGKIAEEIGVSNARVAVLLKKMTAKDLIVKETDPNDARVTTVRLSEHGIETVKAMRKELFEQMGILIDKIGMDRMLEFVMISKEIQEALKPLAVSL